MKLVKPTPEQGRLGLRAMWTVATIDGPPNPEERSVLEAGRRFSGAEVDLADPAALEPITPEALAEELSSDPHLRWQLT